MGVRERKQFHVNIDTLCEACAELCVCPPGDGYINLCADTQEYVEAIAGYAGQILGARSETKKLLERCYIELYEISRDPERREGIRTLAEEIKKCARKEYAPDVIEAAFLCYKASMADSLESIYLAARNDPDCEAFFIPIPYYDKSPDGRLVEMHLEGEGCYPAYYRLTGWEEYHLDLRRPDVIYMMNPYDEMNRVTTVHPAFYSKRLKECTDLLVYVPYFVHYEKIEEVGNTPGVQEADTVIVQSEKVGKQYVESILKYHPEIQRKKVRKKVAALGSPKVDKVQNLRKEDFPLPEPWAEKIRTGSETKKIILYNLSISTALKNSLGKEAGNYLRKIERVFAFFKKKHDVILWWRPHPLLAQTFRSMRPQLYHKYLELVKRFQESGSGIYDDSPDLDRAIVYADACIGDTSSVNLLLQFMGKPVLTQDIGKMEARPMDEAAVRSAVESFIEKGYDNTFILFESDKNPQISISMEGFVDHLDAIMQYSQTQKEKYRQCFANNDGTSGTKIHEYVISELRGKSHE